MSDSNRPSTPQDEIMARSESGLERMSPFREWLGLYSDLFQTVGGIGTVALFLMWVIGWLPDFLALILISVSLTLLFVAMFAHAFITSHSPIESIGGLFLGDPKSPIATTKAKEQSVEKQKAEPNIIFLRSLRFKVKFDEDDIALWTLDGVEAIAAEFMNENLKDRSVREIDNVKALITYESPEHVFKIYYGYWLYEKYIETYFGLEKPRRLLIALENDEGIWAAENHHESPERYHPRTGVLLKANQYAVTVRLIGGSEGGFIKDFQFTLQCKPTLELDLYEEPTTPLTGTKNELEKTKPYGELVTAVASSESQSKLDILYEPIHPYLYRDHASSVSQIRIGIKNNSPTDISRVKVQIDEIRIAGHVYKSLPLCLARLSRDIEFPLAPEETEIVRLAFSFEEDRAVILDHGSRDNINDELSMGTYKFTISAMGTDTKPRRRQAVLDVDSVGHVIFRLDDD